ncbi:MAG: FtsX-like permease family protein [Succinivibrio sp.]|uniref:FtsX-like permease family protein n=1 Tax=Succinivibrio faecicola TaxID=2820300 RepID=A0ABS7DF36_9GAMM|nr:FtsX-like permease family protein [Succinivibrio faecicola]MBW7569717.1 FtsX-like permease family protein [Succinivibrio faecicola]
MFSYLTFKIALQYIFRSKTLKFAKFVAFISVAGIALGVAALIVDTAIMQGLHSNLKSRILSITPHIIADNFKSSDKLLEFDDVLAVSPFIQEQALLQTPGGLSLVYVQGIDENNLKLKNGIFKSDLDLVRIPKKGSYQLNAMASVYLDNNIRLNTQARLISTINSRYTPLGITPSQRIFTLKYYFPSTNTNNSIATVIGNIDDVRRLFRLRENSLKLRIYTKDAFKIDKVKQYLDKNNVSYNLWSDYQGDFFKAIALEKVTMTIMLALIIIVAAFNILSALSMMVTSRLNEIAILKTIGLSDTKIKGIFILMGLIVGVLGTFIGVIIGIPLTYAVVSYMNSMGTMSAVSASIDMTNLIYVAIGSILMSLIFTLYPASRAAKADPVLNLNRG